MESDLGAILPVVVLKFLNSSFFNSSIFRRDWSGQSLDKACQHPLGPVLRLAEFPRHFSSDLTRVEFPAQGPEPPGPQQLICFRSFPTRDSSGRKCLHRKLDPVEETAALRIKTRFLKSLLLKFEISWSLKNTYHLSMSNAWIICFIYITVNAFISFQRIISELSLILAAYFHIQHSKWALLLRWQCVQLIFVCRHRPKT